MSNISLLREKFIIREIGADAVPVIALGNRLKIDLPKMPPLIIRGHSMHMTLRYGAEIIKQLAYFNHIENIESIIQWDDLWERLLTPFEGDNVPKTWICIYHRGEIIFDSGHHHPFFDVIEHAEFKGSQSNERYEKSIETAQNAFRQMGRNVMIDQESHVGFVLENNEKEMRFAIILRTPEQKATFIIRMNEDSKSKLKPYDYICMNLSADYIEAINMSVQSGFMEHDIDTGIIAKYSDKMKYYKKIQKRIIQLGKDISQAENKYKINYRPEKPDFRLIQEECKNFS